MYSTLNISNSVINIHDSIVSISIGAEADVPGSWDIEPCDHAAKTVAETHAEWLRSQPGNYDIEPCDMLAEPLTDAPAKILICVPGQPGDGFAAAELKASLCFGQAGPFYAIYGDTYDSRRLLRAIGCEYSKADRRWTCPDCASLVRYAVPAR